MTGSEPEPSDEPPAPQAPLAADPWSLKLPQASPSCLGPSAGSPSSTAAFWEIRSGVTNLEIRDDPSGQPEQADGHSALTCRCACVVHISQYGLSFCRIQHVADNPPALISRIQLTHGDHPQSHSLAPPRFIDKPSRLDSTRLDPTRPSITYHPARL